VFVSYALADVSSISQILNCKFKLSACGNVITINVLSSISPLISICFQHNDLPEDQQIFFVLPIKLQKKYFKNRTGNEQENLRNDGSCSTNRDPQLGEKR
jgi:hypothetical protein